MSTDFTYSFDFECKRDKNYLIVLFQKYISLMLVLGL